MKLKILTAVSTTEHPGFGKLLNSMNFFKHDFSFLVNPEIQWSWGGLPDIYEWCKTEKEYTHFLYTDGFDTLALSGPDELAEKYKDTDCMLFSSEKGCFPRSDWAHLHPEHDETKRWKYLNHGQFIAPIDVFLELYEGVFGLPITCQEFAMEKYLNGEKRIKLGLDCEIFQSISHIADDEFSVTEGEIGERRLVNNLTGSKAIFAHANGRSEFDWVYKLME